MSNSFVSLPTRGGAPRNWLPSCGFSHQRQLGRGPHHHRKPLGVPPQLLSKTRQTQVYGATFVAQWDIACRETTRSTGVDESQRNLTPYKMLSHLSHWPRCNAALDRLLSCPCLRSQTPTRPRPCKGVEARIVDPPHQVEDGSHVWHLPWFFRTGAVAIQSWKIVFPPVGSYWADESVLT